MVVIRSARRRAVARLLLLAGAVAGAMAGPRRAHALALADLSQRDASAGLKAALERAAGLAVELLSKTDGFWGNDLVRIGLPDWLQKSERLLKLAGRGRQVDELKLGINRAAEQAAPEARTLLVNAIRSMTVDDARALLQGGDDAATRFFASKTREPLTGRFMPVVARVTERSGLARQYNALAGEGEKLGLVKPDEARIERHVTTRALDGLYLTIGAEEKKIRQNPGAAASDLISKAFGATK